MQHFFQMRGAFLIDGLRHKRDVPHAEPDCQQDQQKDSGSGRENNGSYTLTGITRNGQPLRDDDTITVTCLATSKQMEALLASKSGTSEDGDAWVKNTWRDHVSGGGAALAEPENYMTLR